MIIAQVNTVLLIWINYDSKGFLNEKKTILYYDRLNNINGMWNLLLCLE